MIDLNIFNICGIIFTGLVVGFLSGLFGTGGGFLLTPALRIIFGIPYNLAVGSSLAVIAVTSFFGVFKHHFLNHVKYLLGIIIIIGILPGVEIGARILNYLKNSSLITIHGRTILLMDIVLNLCYIGLLLLAAVIMFLEYRKWAKGHKKSIDLSSYRINFCLFKNNPDRNINSISIIGLILSGFAVGILQGLLGVGGGFILIPLLVNIFCIPAVIVVGTSLFIICPSSAFGSITHIFKGNVNLILIILLLMGSLIGSYFGSNITGKIRGKKFRLYFILIIIIVVIMVLVKFLSQTGFL